MTSPNATEPSASVAPCRTDAWTGATLVSFAAALLGIAVQLNNGSYSSLGFVLVAAAGVLLIAAALNVRLPAIEMRGETVVVAALGFGLIASFAQLAGQVPGIYLESGPYGLRIFQHGMGAAAVVAGLTLFAPLRIARHFFFAALALHLGFGVWVVAASPDPAIDVVLYHVEAIKALFAGESPFSITVPNIYGEGTPFYPASLISNGRVQIGYPYPPLGLLLAIPGHLLGDYRLATLIAMEVTAILLAFARPGRVSLLAALVLLFTPRTFFIVEQGWTEPFVLLTVAATVFVAFRSKRHIAIPLGLLFAVKQYPFIAAAFAFFLDRAKFSWRTTARTLAIAAAIAAATVIPFVVWDFKGVWWSVIETRGIVSYRYDSLTFLAWLHRHGVTVGAWVGTVLMFILLGISLWRGTRSPAGFATALAAVFFVAFAFGAAAHCNYYYFVIGLCCTSVATRCGADDLESAVVLHRAPAQVRFEAR